MWINWIFRTGSAPFTFYGYRLAICYFRVVKGGSESYPRFLSDFGGHSLTVWFWFWSTRGLGFGRPADGEDSTLEVPWSYAETRGFSRVKTGLVSGNYWNSVSVLFSDMTGVWLAGIYPIHRSCRCWDRMDGGRGCLVAYLGLFDLCGVKLHILVCKSTKVNSWLL
jgi:hypothetical protein